MRAVDYGLRPLLQISQLARALSSSYLISEILIWNHVRVNVEVPGRRIYRSLEIAIQYKALRISLNQKAHKDWRFAYSLL